MERKIANLDFTKIKNFNSAKDLRELKDKSVEEKKTWKIHI